MVKKLVSRAGVIMEKKIDLQLFQGPVRLTDDENYFRLTGITRPLEVNK